jgi:hypothetical protein
MFVLRFKPDTYRLLWCKESKAYVSQNIGGRFFCDSPSIERGYTTTDLNQAKVFNDETQMSNMYFADTQPIRIRIELTQ